MSTHIAKFFKAPLVLASAALVMHISAATAADAQGDIQQQMRELLAGTRTTHFVPQSGPREGKATPPVVDSQEFAKQLLLGAAAYRIAGAETGKPSEAADPSGKTEAHKRPVASVDMQAAVRQLLLGQSHARDAS